MRYFFDRQSNALELVLSFHIPRQKNKIIRAYSDPGHSDFEKLVDELVRRNPNADLRSLPAKEAYAKMGAVNMTRTALTAVPIILLVSMAVIGSPFLVHGLDDGLAKVSVELLQSGQPLTSRNLELSGILDTERGIIKTITHKGTTTTHNYLKI